MSDPFGYGNYYSPYGQRKSSSSGSMDTMAPMSKANDVQSSAAQAPASSPGFYGGNKDQAGIYAGIPTTPMAGGYNGPAASGFANYFSKPDFRDPSADVRTTAASKFGNSDQPSWMKSLLSTGFSASGQMGILGSMGQKVLGAPGSWYQSGPTKQIGTYWENMGQGSAIPKGFEWSVSASPWLQDRRNQLNDILGAMNYIKETNPGQDFSGADRWASTLQDSYKKLYNQYAGNSDVSTGGF